MATKQFSGTVEKITIVKDRLRNEQAAIIQLFIPGEILGGPWTMRDIIFTGGMTEQARALDSGDEITVDAAYSGEHWHGFSIVGNRSIV